MTYAIRVEDKKGELIGNFEVPIIPQVGDFFMVGDNEKAEILERCFCFKDDNRFEDVLLTVKDKSGYTMAGYI